MRRALLLFHTLRHLTRRQILYRLYYALRNGITSRLFPSAGLLGRQTPSFPSSRAVRTDGPLAESGTSAGPTRPATLTLIDSIPAHRSYVGEGFRFVGQSDDFPAREGEPQSDSGTTDARAAGAAIDWNYGEHGKLWTYNLCYFDYLLQEDMERWTGLELIGDFHGQLESVREGMEPYPVSLRGINWIKFITRHGLRDEVSGAGGIAAGLYAQYRLLERSPEYHLLGNHLLENGFSLLFGAYFFGDTSFYNTARGILEQELPEQTREDGAHFELSPMYHSIIIYRLLDVINVVAHNPPPAGGADTDEGRAPEAQAPARSESDEGFLRLLCTYVGRMLYWLQKMRYADGSLPMLNDAAPGIAPSPAQLFDYAGRLGLDHEPNPFSLPLGESGYRRFGGSRYELLVDAGPIGPSYIPGHAHCDMLSFELRIEGRPFIVDTGTSTYEAGERRSYERSTAAHNTVVVDGYDQSEIWSSFRVARRAGICLEEESPQSLRASCRFYTLKRRLHRREFSAGPESILIVDRTEGEVDRAEAFFHFAPGMQREVEKSELRDHEVLLGPARLSFEGAQQIELQPCSIADGFGRLEESLQIVVRFRRQLHTEIHIR